MAKPKVLWAYHTHYTKRHQVSMKRLRAIADELESLYPPVRTSSNRQDPDEGFVRHIFEHFAVELPRDNPPRWKTKPHGSFRVIFDKGKVSVSAHESESFEKTGFSWSRPRMHYSYSAESPAEFFEQAQVIVRAWDCCRRLTQILEAEGIKFGDYNARTSYAA